MLQTSGEYYLSLKKRNGNSNAYQQDNPSHQKKTKIGFLKKNDFFFKDEKALLKWRNSYPLSNS
jgi:hypothetical protein